MAHRTPSGRHQILGMVVVLILTGLPPTAFGAQVFSDSSIQTSNAKTLLLFPMHQISDVALEQSGEKVVTLDIPFYSFQGAPKIVLAPHPKVKFARISGVSTNPDVTRVTLVFQQPTRCAARIEDGHLMLVESPRAAVRPSPEPSPAPSAAKGVSPAEARPAVPQSYEVPAASRNVLDEKISLQFENEDLLSILNALAMKFNLRISADSGVKGKFTVNAQDVPLREVLKTLLLQKNFQYSLKGKELTVISLGQESDRMARELLFKDLSLKDALQTLSRMMNVNLIIHESVEDKKVNFFVENLSLDELLDLLVTTNDLVKVPHNENTFVIMTKKDAKDFGAKQYRTFKLVNAAPKEIISLIEGTKALADKIDTKNLSVNERINALSVYDTLENLNLIQNIIESIDEKVKQAVIELKLVEINRESAKALGIRLDNYNIALNDLNRIPTSIELPATLDFLEKNNKAKVLASPKIRAVHKKKASISIGKVYPVPYFRYENASSTYLGYVPQTYKEYRDVKVGIKLDVTPEISRDNEISLDLNTTVDSVDQINTDGQITRSERTTNTFVRIKDGETVVLGGLISQNSSNQQQSPAVLNKVPLLRNLLSNSKIDSTESEMIILVTPHLVNLDFDVPEKEDFQGLIVEKH